MSYKNHMEINAESQNILKYSNTKKKKETEKLKNTNQNNTTWHIGKTWGAKATLNHKVENPWRKGEIGVEHTSQKENKKEKESPLEIIEKVETCRSKISHVTLKIIWIRSKAS